MSVSSKNFDQNYYFNTCFGSDEFIRSKGREITKRVQKLIDSLNLSNEMVVLEVGCGRGDTSLYIAKKVKRVIGIDYSKDAIKIANKVKSQADRKTEQKLKFLVMRADKMNFKDNIFDFIIMIDTLDHLNKYEVENTFKSLMRMLKPDGKIFIKTCANKILLDKTYRYYIHPMNKVLTTFDKFIKGIYYESLPDDPRTKEAKIQHINEADYFYIRKLMRKYKLKADIKAETGFLTNNKGIRSKIYNFIVTLYPVSQYFPLNVLFAHAFLISAKKNDRSVKIQYS